ncbi:MAG: NYN domain-containing protein [Gammaproteobacteria bacterium]|nr:NYN domain-containing protein [Gammaproteobacteria bacterium]
MSSASEDQNLAIFCDFENVALGVRDARIEKFNINLVLERLLVKGSVVVKKAYCDWERYKEFKAVMHDAAFELIEIPHTRQSGKNSADIRMVVDALDLCYTKEHIDSFVIVSGDSDFSPLVSKLRENNKTVIGVGVKSSTSDLLMSNCDEFIFYDDLAREAESSKQRSRKSPPRKKAASKKSSSKQVEAARPEEDKLDDDRPEEDKMDEAIALVMETAEALYGERGDRDKLWGSMVKQALKRRRPGFNERYYGVRSFSDLLEEAERRELIRLSLDERSGGYLIQKIDDA